MTFSFTRSYHLFAGILLLLVLRDLVFPSLLKGQDNKATLSIFTEGYRPVSFQAADTGLVMAMLRPGEKFRNMPTDSALNLLNSAYSKSVLIGFNDGVAGSLIEMGKIETQIGNQEQALYIYEKALWYSKRSNTYKHLAAACYSNMGSIHLFKDELKLAAQYFDSSLKEGVRAALPVERKHLVITYNNLSIIYSKMRRPNVALEYLKQGEGIARRNHFDKELKLTLCNLGNVYADLNRPKDALACFNEVLTTATADGDKEMVKTANISLGQFYMREGQPEKAIHYTQAAYDNMPSDDIYYGKIIPGYTLGRAYYELGKFALAENYIKTSLNQAAATGFQNGALNAHETLGKVYEATGQYKKAIEQFRICAQLNDSLLNREQTSTISELEIKYKSAEKDKLLVISNRDMLRATIENRNKNLLLISCAILLALVIAGFIIFRLFQKNKVKRLKQHQELAMLRATIAGEEAERTRVGQELHDGIGGYFSAIKINLASLRMKRQELEADPIFIKTIAIADYANEELREIAHNLMPPVLVEKGLGEAVRAYCKNGVSSETLEAEIQVTGSPARFNFVSELAIYRILQELIHNIVKHAMASRLTVCFNWQTDLLMIAIEDDGIGEYKSDGETGGMGLQNINSRIAAFKGAMTIDHFEGQGTSVYLEFELPGKNKIKLK